MRDPESTSTVRTQERVRQIAVPESARALSTLSRIDCDDALLVDVGPIRKRTAEQWARAVLEDAPVAVRHSLQSGWPAIGLKLARSRSGRFVQGWELRCRDSDLALLVADSRVGSGELLLGRRDGLLFCTFVQQDNQIARALWAGVELAHVPVVRGDLEQTSRRIRFQEQGQ